MRTAAFQFVSVEPRRARSCGASGFDPWVPILIDCAKIETGHRVLDIGCGTGGFTRAIADIASAAVTGIDISERFIEFARDAPAPKRGAVAWRVGSAESLPVAEGSFDRAVLSLVLHQLANPKLAVAEAFRSLAADGRVVVRAVAPEDVAADGMVEEIITALSRIRIARNSSFTYKGQAVDVKQAGRDLRVRYVLEGSVRKAGGRVRITGQLIDTTSGAHLSADRFDGSLGDVFELQDKVASSVAGVIEPALQAAETARWSRRPTADLTAYDLYLRACAMFFSSDRQVLEALRLTEQAIVRDPHYGPALAWSAYCYFRLLLDGRSEDPAADRLKGADFARRALEVASDDPGVLATSAFALAYFGETIPLTERAIQLSPRDPELGFWYQQIGMAHLLQSRTEDAILWLEKARDYVPAYSAIHRDLAAAYALRGEIERAAAELTEARRLSSDDR
jgi:TolB-like protein